MSSAGFDRAQLLDALDEIGRAAVAVGGRLDIAVFGGSALMLAGNFRFSTEDADIAEIAQPWPAWLSETVQRIAERNGWSQYWLNEAVTFHLSRLAEPARDLVAFGTFPRGEDKVGLTVFVPTAKYMLALKLKALRMADPAAGPQDMADVANLLRVLDIRDIEAAIAVLAEYFPNSAADAEKQRFVLRHILSSGGAIDAPRYPRPGV
jgi:hypothetical protein